MICSVLMVKRETYIMIIVRTLFVGYISSPTLKRDDDLSPHKEETLLFIRLQNHFLMIIFSADPNGDETSATVHGYIAIFQWCNDILGNARASSGFLKQAHSSAFRVDDYPLHSQGSPHNYLSNNITTLCALKIHRRAYLCGGTQIIDCSRYIRACNKNADA